MMEAKNSPPHVRLFQWNHEPRSDSHIDPSYLARVLFGMHRRTYIQIEMFRPSRIMAGARRALRAVSCQAPAL